MRCDYDTRGNLIRMVDPVGSTRHVYHAAGNLLAEVNASGPIQKYFIYARGLAGKVTNTYVYAPYGKILAKQEAVAQPFKYAGQVGIMDEGTDLLYMRARYCDASIRRFISKHPAGFVDGPNLYAYVGGELHEHQEHKKGNRDEGRWGGQRENQAELQRENQAELQGESWRNGHEPRPKRKHRGLRETRSVQGGFPARFGSRIVADDSGHGAGRDSARR